jgi:hypothetical protein
MLSIKTFKLFLAALGGALMTFPCHAQTASAPMPANYIHVDAPTAQRLVVAEKNQHPEILKLGLHATPPGATDNAIIASDTPSKIGKKSSASDMQNLAGGKALALKIEKEKIYDLLLPITDAHGGDLRSGFVVMEAPFSKADNEQQALKIGIAIRDELQSEIASQAALYLR